MTVRRLEDILETLDQHSTLDGLPFMPEMAAFCGRTYRVSRRVERTCVEGHWPPRAFAANDVVFLEELRCSGADHDGCQRGCMLFWKEAWLARAATGGAAPIPSTSGPGGSGPDLKTRADAERYFCQSTELKRATDALTLAGRARSMVREVLVGNRSAAQMLAHVVVPLWRKVRKRIVDDTPRGTLAVTPAGELALRPGEWVRILPLDAIRRTLDAQGRNRGLGCPFASKVFAGGTFRVRSRLDRMIAETTGRMRTVQHTVSLDGVRCQCFYIPGGCPRRELLYWREIWLERVEPAAAESARRSVRRAG